MHSGSRRRTSARPLQDLPVVRTRARTHTRARNLTSLTSALVVGACLLAGLSSTPRAQGAGATAAATAPARSIPALGGRWFGVGANVPFVEYRCDFGCGNFRGVR